MLSGLPKRNVRDYGDWQQEKLAFCHGELKDTAGNQSWSEKIQGTSVITFFFFCWVVIKMDSKKLNHMGSTGGLQVFGLCPAGKGEAPRTN